MDTIYDAAQQGDLEEVQRQVADDPKCLNRQGTGGWTALFWAAAGGHTDIVRFLLSEGTDAQISDDRGHKASYWAGKYHGDSGATRLLLAEHAKWINSAPTVAEFAAAREKTVDAVHNAVREGDQVALGELLQSDRDLVNCKDDLGATPLSIATSQGNAAMRDYLLSIGADASVSSAEEQAACEETLAEDRRRVAEFVRTTDRSHLRNNSEPTN